MVVTCFFFVCFVFVVLEMEPRALYMLGKCSTTELNTQLLVVIFD
jgi:hypothetical protein